MFSQIKLRLILVFIVSSLLSLYSQAELTSKRVIGLSGAKKIAAAAELEAVGNKWNVVIVVVDDGGHLVYLQRLDVHQRVVSVLPLVRLALQQLLNDRLRYLMSWPKRDLQLRRSLTSCPSKAGFQLWWVDSLLVL